MPSQRRAKVFGLLVAVVLLTILYMSNGGQSTRTSEFYSRTVSALDIRHKAAQEAFDLENHKKIAEQAEAAHKVDKDAGARNPEPPVPGAPKEQKPFAVDVDEAAKAAASVADSVKEGVKDAVHGTDADEKSVAGRKMMKMKDDGVAKVGNTGPQGSSAAGDKTDDEHKAEAELNAILKKSPIIIFSKSYCPYSKKAKHILLDKYNIVPAPYVEELDQHPLGVQLQAALQKTTGRRTVPNVMINGKSIGGGDDVEALDLQDKMVDTIKTMGGKRMTEVSRVKEDIPAKAAIKFKV